MCSVFNLGVRWSGWLTPHPCRFSPVTEPVPLVQDAGWYPGKVWTSSKNLTPPRYDPQTLQPVSSHYAHCAIPAHATGIVEFHFPLQKNLILPTCILHYHSSCYPYRKEFPTFSILTLLLFPFVLYLVRSDHPFATF